MAKCRIIIDHVETIENLVGENIRCDKDATHSVFGVTMCTECVRVFVQEGYVVEELSSEEE